MERYKENIKSRRDQNLMSFVLMVCFLMMALSFWGAFSTDHKTAESAENTANVLVANSK